MPDEMRDLAAEIYSELAPALIEELALIPRSQWFRPRTVERLMTRVAPAVEAAQPRVYAIAVERPSHPGRLRSGELVAGATSAAAAVAEDVVIVTLQAPGYVAALLAQLGAELVEVWAVAQARADAYRRAGRTPTTEMVAADVGEWAGFGLARRQAAGELRRFLARRFAERVQRRVVRAFVPIAGALWNGATSAAAVRRLRRLPLRPVDDDELSRMAAERGL